MVSLCRVYFSAQPFVSFLLPNFLFFVFVVSFFQKKNFWFGFVFRLFCVLFDCGKIKNGFQKNNLSSSNLVWVPWRFLS